LTSWGNVSFSRWTLLWEVCKLWAE